MKPLLANLLPLGAVALLWRIAQWLSPSIGMTVIGIFLFLGLAVFYAKQPVLRPTLKWAWLILAGGCLNFAAILANGGIMPYPHVMSAAWWVWLGDWIGGLVSPGDILMTIGFVGIVAMLIRNRKQIVGQEA